MESLNWFLKSIKKSDSVIILGDIFDSRSSVDFKILNDAIDFFITLSRSCKEVFILVGNHDLYYKENDLNNVNCRFLRFDADKGSKIAPVKIVHETSEIKIQGKSCLFIPWIDSEEKKDAAKQFLLGTHDVVFGHFDTVGLYNGKDLDTSLMMKQEDFGNHQVVLSGHYHKRSENGIVQYVGAFINQTFNDVGDTKGYHTIDKKGAVKFVEGICPRFEYITIPNPAGFLKGFEMASEPEKEKVRNRIKGNIIKLILNEYGTENDELYKIFKDMTPLEISISYNRVAFEDEVDGEEEFAGFDSKSDIIEIISQYIDKVQKKLPEGVKPSDIVELISKKHAEFKSVG
jgi:DNA repair exonuclease SbcCD nuclease subunit